ncbi:hypothetical protein ACIPY2_17340 [Paenarthrobacter sp. NPDC089675]|uniref:hypothetical protein n=1 Tax=Paenarthrobacter sp. NPDC089675 TaxID=3364376 RepID=UPI0038219EEC
MQDRVVFPDFSAFQIDIPHGPWPHETGWAGAGHPHHEVYADFWPDVQVSHEGVPSEGSVEGPAEGG